MELTRRQWLALAATTTGAAAWRPANGFAAGQASPSAGDGSAAIAARAAALIAEFEAQGHHRTATDVDRQSGEWLAAQVRATGLTPTLEPFPLQRVDLVDCAVIVGDRRLDAVPLFDAAFTDAAGIRGRLGPATSGADIALSETPTNAAAAGPLGEARRSGRHKAIVAITRGRRPGLCPSNADDFLQPFGPPVLQVGSDEADWLTAQAARGVDVRVIAHVRRTAATATNVVTTIAGRNPALAPFIVMTPRSGWYWCASERGGGIVCWLEIMRALRQAGLPRTVHFVASSGHELGHLGINAFIAARSGIVPAAVGWLHLGANIAAAVDASNTLQSSHDEFDAALTSAMRTTGLVVNQRAPRNRVPGGEAEAVHRGGGRYISVIGGNGLFHNLTDRGPQAVDVAAMAKFSLAFTSAVRALATDGAVA